MPRYQATYKDPIDGSITHYWEFEATDKDEAQFMAKDSVLQRRDGNVDILDKLEEINK